jgi:hypothetical protein
MLCPAAPFTQEGFHALATAVDRMTCRCGSAERESYRLAQASKVPLYIFSAHSRGTVATVGVHPTDWSARGRRAVRSSVGLVVG